MRYGNPIESLLHGIIRQNLGCTHRMFGRDHAAVGDYYDMSDPPLNMLVRTSDMKIVYLKKGFDKEGLELKLEQFLQ
jgi:ATP sulfurylase